MIANSRRPQEQQRSSAASSSAIAAAAGAAGVANLGQLGKSSNSSNETVIALDQTTAAAAATTTTTVEAKAAPISEANDKAATNDDNDDAKVGHGEQTNDEKNDPMIYNQDRCAMKKQRPAEERDLVVAAAAALKETTTTKAQDDMIAGLASANNNNSSGEQNQQTKQQQQQPSGKLRGLLLLTQHLNPFRHSQRHHLSQQQQQQLRRQLAPHQPQANHKHQVKRKQSLDSLGEPKVSPASECSASGDGGGCNGCDGADDVDANNLHDHNHRNQFVNLFSLVAQRCFSFRNSSVGVFDLHTARDSSGKQRSGDEIGGGGATSKSAPVTPIKWNSLAGGGGGRHDEDGDHRSAGAGKEMAANGLGPAGQQQQQQQQQSQRQASSKPSVRFLESSCKEGASAAAAAAAAAAAGKHGDRPKWRALTKSGGGGQRTSRAVQTQTSGDRQQQPPPPPPPPTSPPGEPGPAAAAGQPSRPRASKWPAADDEPSTTSSSLVASLFKPLELAGDGGGGGLIDEGESPMNSERFRQHGYSLIDYISNYLDTIKERRVTPLNIEPGYLKSLIEPDAPELGEPFANIMHDFENKIMCGITHWQHPHFHAYFPAGNAYASILADMLSDALGCVGFSWAASPAYTELEIIMLDWMGKMIGLPEEFLCLSGGATRDGHESKGGGVIQGSASECVLVNLLAARHWAMEKLRKRYPGQPDGMLLTKLIGYCSKEAHSCVEKAAMIGFIRMRALDTDEQHSLRGETLAKAIAMDRANGLEPFLVCATLGTTSCVSFDNLAELGPVCRDEDIWLHVDAAYAGSALICPEFKYLMAGIELASSFNMNPNKWMLINFDCSLMWVKDRFKLTRAFVVDPLYLQHSFSDQAIDYRHWGIPLSRRFRALKLWFVIRNYGIAGLQAYIRNHVRLAKLFEQLIRQDSRFTINNQVVLGLVCFRLIGSNALNQRLLSMINASGKLHMVPASLEGRYVIRFCVCDQNAKEEDIRYAYECIAQFATELFDSIRAGKERIRAISQQNTIDVSSVSLHTQQSASADRLNRMAAAAAAAAASSSSSCSFANEQQQQAAAGACADDAHSQPAAAAAAAAAQPVWSSPQPASDASCASPNRQAARQYLMASRRNSHALVAEPAGELPPGGAAGSASSRSPSQLQKQASVLQGTSSEPASSDPLADHLEEDLEQEIILDSLASIDGLDYDLDSNDDDEDADDADEDHDELPIDQVTSATAAGPANPDEPAAEPPPIGQAPAAGQRGNRRWPARPSSRRRFPQTTAASATGERDEAEDEVFHLAQERRNRMSLRYKREFFVRVVSDPRVYRASISGDINASCNSLSNAPTSATTQAQTQAQAHAHAQAQAQHPAPSQPAQAAQAQPQQQQQQLRSNSNEVGR